MKLASQEADIAIKKSNDKYLKLKERNSPKFFVKASAALHTHANKMQIKTSPFFASRLYPSITSCDNETNVKTHCEAAHSSLITR